MITTTLRSVLAGITALVITVALGALSQIPYEADAAQHAVVRLAWRTRSVRVEECRRPSAAELENVPVHMRREEVCEGQVLPYRLRVLIDGESVVDELVRGAGAREDRPLYVNHELPVTPGRHDLEVRFERQGDVPTDAVATEATPAELVVRRTLELGAKSVALVTYDAGARRLVLVGEMGSADATRP